METYIPRDHSRREILKAAKQALNYWGEPLRYARGETLEAVFRSCEHGEVVVYWGLWTKKDLQTVIA